MLPLPYKSRGTKDEEIQPFDDSNQNNIVQSLSNPKTISLPMTLRLNREYTITGFVAQGADGAIYEGSYQLGDEVKEVVIKIYLSGRFFKHFYPPLESFNNEKFALSKLGRLIEADETNLIVVMPKIKGIPLSEVIQKLRSNVSENDENQQILKGLMSKYLKLPAEFQNKWGLVHMDIHPGNVIVDEDGEMVLIDFSRSKPYENGQRDRLRANLDSLYAKLGAAYYFNIPIEELTDK